MVTRSEADIEAEIAEIKAAAVAAGRGLTEAESEQIDDLIVERAAAFRAEDARWRNAYVRERRDHWYAKDRFRLRTALRPSWIFLAIAGAFVCTSILLLLGPSEQFVQPLTILFVLTGWIISLCVHEFGHAIMGYLGGDRGVMSRGYLNLDPRRYTNPLLSVILPVVFIILGGIGLPGGAVRVDREWLKSRNWDLAVSVGGPVGTLICLCLAGAPFLFGATQWMTEDNVYFFGALGALVRLLAVVLVLNLLPIPPLDGFRILAHCMSEETRQRAFALGWLPIMFFYFFVLTSANPITSGFWFFADMVTLMFPIPHVYTEHALDLLSLRRT